jgi:hypothetical protein
MRSGSGQAPVDEADLRPAGVGDKVDLNGGRSGRDLDVGSFPAVGEHDATVGDELDELARAAVAVGVGPADQASGPGIDVCRFGHPLDEQRSVSEQLVDERGRRANLDGSADEPHPVPRRPRPRRSMFSAVVLSASSRSPQNASRNARSWSSRSASTR